MKLIFKLTCLLIVSFGIVACGSKEDHKGHSGHQGHEQHTPER